MVMRSLRARAHIRAPFTDQAVYVYQGISVAIAFKRSSRGLQELEAHQSNSVVPTPLGLFEMNTGFCAKGSNPVFSRPPEVTVGPSVAFVTDEYSWVPLGAVTVMVVPAGTAPET